jgi:hypothetical protein
MMNRCRAVSLCIEISLKSARRALKYGALALLVAMGFRFWIAIKKRTHANDDR